MPLTRSKSKSEISFSEPKTRKAPALCRVPRRLETLSNASPEIRRALLEQSFRSSNSFEPRTEQIEICTILLKGMNAFLLAGTGFGKSKIPEMYLNTFHKVDKPVVLVLNPLDALGDNQVTEKTVDGFTAVNLTQRSFTEEVYKQVLAGHFQFIYLSPEIFLNSPLFTTLYFQPSFQRRLVLKVIDEAHLIYYWGLVASGHLKHSACFKNLQDTGVFRPSYGNLFSRLLASEEAPILLMSATCRPKAMDAIKRNLRLGEHNLEVRIAELVRPEIRLIRVMMQHPLKSAKDLKPFFGNARLIPDEDLPPTLLYSGTQNGTWETLCAVNEGRGHPERSSDGNSTCARRYHAATGTDDKTDRASDFVACNFAVICCTMALGLGQNWKLVRRVVVIGRMDPAAVVQMIGRCGRDKRPGVGVMLVEQKRGGVGAKNDLKEFGPPELMSDDERMDALAITPVCLRVAIGVDNYKGHIPISFDDPDYIVESARQKAAGFPRCICSNCEPQMALEFLNSQHQASKKNFTDIALGTYSQPISHDICCTPFDKQYEADLQSILTCPPSDKARNMKVIQSLVNSLMSDIDILYNVENADGEFCISRHVVFNLEKHAWPIAKNADVISKGVSLRFFLGSEAIDGMFKCILDCISKWQNSEIYLSNVSDIAQLYKIRVAAATKRFEQSQQKKTETITKKRDSQLAHLDNDISYKSKPVLISPDTSIEQNRSTQTTHRPSKRSLQVAKRPLAKRSAVDGSNSQNAYHQTNCATFETVEREGLLQQSSQNGILPPTPQTPDFIANPTRGLDSRADFIGTNPSQKPYTDLFHTPVCMGRPIHTNFPLTTPLETKSHSSSYNEDVGFNVRHLNNRSPLSNRSNYNHVTLPGIQTFDSLGSSSTKMTYSHISYSTVSPSTNINHKMNNLHPSSQPPSDSLHSQRHIINRHVQHNNARLPPSSNPTNNPSSNNNKPTIYSSIGQATHEKKN
ncbi:P-loop containing nucleoside triphosphate hydrolase protein [Melampsora americana]|nr:P-loop containing nucleoside triphosphate hydrolase protein [Melampsora americana]